MGGGIAVLVRFTDVLPFGVMGRDLLLIVAVAVISGLVSLPFSYRQTFGIEVRFGFNRTTRKLWLVDLVKGVAIGAALGLPLAALVMWLMRAAGPWWWLWAWAAWIGFQFLLLALYPDLHRTAVQQVLAAAGRALRERIEALLRALRVCLQGVFVVDGSRRSSHGNAYFTGFGRHKRIVFFDTLLERLAHPEVEAVLAHELGHLQPEARAQATAAVDRADLRGTGLARLAGAPQRVLHRPGCPDALDARAHCCCSCS